MGDILYNFTEWLRSTQLVELAFWISDTSLCLWIVTHFWAIPTLQTIHILAIAGLFGSVLMVNLRVLNVIGAHRNFAQTAKRFLPWIRWSFVAVLVTGVLMIIGEPIRELINPVFWVKMGLIVIAVPFSLAFNKKVAGIDATGTASAGMRLSAVLLIVLWCIVMAGGRWIAYAPV